MEVTKVLDNKERLKIQEKEAIKRIVFLESIVEGIPDIIGVHRPDRTNIYMNVAAREFYSCEGHECIGSKCYELRGKDKKCKGCRLEEVIDKKEIVRGRKVH